MRTTIVDELHLDEVFQTSLSDPNIYRVIDFNMDGTVIAVPYCIHSRRQGLDELRLLPQNIVQLLSAEEVAEHNTHQGRIQE